MFWGAQVIIVSDRELSEVDQWVIDGKPVIKHGVADFDVGAENIMVIDVDLQNKKTVARLGERLSRLKTPPMIACAVDMHSYRSRADAIILGATSFLPKPFGREDLEIVARQATDLEVAPESAVRSVDSASDMLGASFAALSAQSNLKVDEVLNCGDEILTSIKADGMQTWLSVVRARHEGTFQHCLIVTGLATNFASYWGMNRTDVEKFSTAGLLHDIGKVRIPNELLDKPGRLTDEEFEIIKTHPVVGYDYLVGQQGMTEELLGAVRHHHEALDGSGYPDRLKGGEIDDLTRILTICDVYGALVEHRAYKRQALPEEAIGVLMKMADENKVERTLVKAFAKTVDVSLPLGERLQPQDQIRAAS